MNPGVNHQSNGGVARSPASPSVHRTDLGLALVLLGVCAFLWWDTTQFADVPASLAQNAPPTTFPRLLLGAIALMSLMLPFEHRFKDDGGEGIDKARAQRSEEHTSELQSLMRISYAVFCLKKKKQRQYTNVSTVTTDTVTNAR